MSDNNNTNNINNVYESRNLSYLLFIQLLLLVITMDSGSKNKNKRTLNFNLIWWSEKDHEEKEAEGYFLLGAHYRFNNEKETKQISFHIPNAHKHILESIKNHRLEHLASAPKDFDGHTTEIVNLRLAELNNFLVE